MIHRRHGIATEIELFQHYFDNNIKAENTTERTDNPMGKKKRSGNEDKLTKAILLVTALLSLVKAVVDLITSLTR